MAKQLLGLGAQAGARKETDFKLDKVSKKDVAVIGMSVYLPQINDTEEFWLKIAGGADLVGSLPEKRKKDIELYLKYKNIDTREIKYNEQAYLDEIDKFDYSFFRLSPKEAELMDPNQRLFLETAWKALEDAGYGGNRLRGSRTGVYLGYAQGNSFYHNLVSELNPGSAELSLPGNLASIIASRISYYLDLKGTSLLVDTACSSSLVALHLACQSIRSGECEMALAGSVKIDFVPVSEGEGIGIESSDGRTRTFDDSSDGTGSGEGVAAIFLKPLYKAVEDGDNIHAVIRGSAANQDGASIGITAPNVLAQEEVIARAWMDAGIDPQTITYIEAHGTGTKLGDPIEIDGITRAFRRYTDKKQFCGVGSLKTNMGHLDHAAGIGGIVKAVLALKNKELPPMIHFCKPNRNIDFENSPVYVVDTKRAWETDGIQRRCGVSAFGLSGTNCHVVLEEAPEVPRRKSRDNEYNILSLSAKTSASLMQLILKYKGMLDKGTDINIDDLCFTANTGRGHYSHRLSIIAGGIRELKEKIDVISGKELNDIEHEGIYYSRHKVLAPRSLNSTTLQAASEPRRESEFTEREIAEFSNITDEKIEQYVKDKSGAVLHDICRLYIKGADIAWDKLYSGQKRLKLSLPTYPFERKRCFISIPAARRNIYYETVWKEERLKHFAAENRKEKIVLFKLKGITLQDQLAKKLNDSFDAVEIEIDNRHAADCEELERRYKLALQSAPDTPVKIVHMVSLGLQADENMSGLHDSLNKGVFSLFQLVKCLASNKKHSISEVILISDNACHIQEHGKFMNPPAAAMFGLAKAARIECPEINFRCIDMDYFTDINPIVDEIKAGYSDFIAAYRRNLRYIEELRPLDIDKRKDINLQIKSSGVYIITGGTGKIGLQMAKYLASCGAANIALLQRSEIPSDGSREKLFEKGGNSRYQEIMTAIAQIEATGSRVTCMAADVTEEAQLKPVLENLCRRFGRIHGIIHCAGVGIGNEGADIRGQDLDEFKGLIAPKVYGTWLIDYLTRDNSPDFIVMFSSVMALTGGFGGSDYTCANAYLDAYAYYASMKGTRAAAINWPAWKNTINASDEVLGSHLFNPVEGGEALEAFECILHKDVTRVIVGEMNRSGELLSMDGILPFRLSKDILSGFEAAAPEDGKAALSEVALEGKADGNYSGVERQVALVWGGVLGFDRINVYHSFYDMGGDSIFAMKIINNLNQQLGTDLDIREVLMYPSVYELAQYIDCKMGNKGETGIPPCGEREYYPLSSAQKRIYIESRIEKSSTSYNMPSALLVEGSIDRVKLLNAFNSLLKRHEALRTYFDMADGEAVQKVRNDAMMDMEYREASENEIDNILQSFIRPFDLSKAPLFRAGLVRLNEEKHILMIDMHHIISDGISIGILTDELIKLYEGIDLPELKLTYKDYAVWQNETFKDGRMKKQEEFYLAMLLDMPKLKLPVDFEIDGAEDNKGDAVSLTLDTALCEKLSKRCREMEVTTYMMLLGAYNILLSKLSGQDDIIVASPAAGRPHHDLSGIVGMFVNTLVMRNRPSSLKTVRDFLKEVKENTLDVFNNQDYQFDWLVEKLGVSREQNKNPVFDTVFALQNMEINEISIKGMKFIPYEFSEKEAKAALSLAAAEEDGAITLDFEYFTALFRRDTIVKLSECYVIILEAIADSMEVRIGDISIVQKDEIDEITSKIQENRRAINVEFDF